MLSKKTAKAMKVYAVRRLWKDAADLFFTAKPILEGAYKQAIIFTIEIPKGTRYEENYEQPMSPNPMGNEKTRLFTFGGISNGSAHIIRFPVYMG